MHYVVGESLQSQTAHGGGTVAVLRQVSEQAPAPIRERNPAVPVWLESLVQRLMVKEPAERFQSAAEVAALLEGYLSHLQRPDAVPAPILPLPRVQGDT